MALRLEEQRVAAHGCGGRLHASDETVARVRPWFPRFGITRLGRLTGLDRIGIPVWMATRPAAWTLAVSQGKGVTDADAQASAAMESIEIAVAECPEVPIRMARCSALDGRVNLLASLLAAGQLSPDAGEVIGWLRGIDLVTGDPTWVPSDAITLDYRPRSLPCRYWQSTDGLASGNCLWEAVMHGLCERIERDASALWSFRSPAEIRACCVDPDWLGSTAISRFTHQIRQAGHCLRLFDITTDLGIPTFFATISPPPGGATQFWRHFDLASGRGCHPDPRKAALRAVTEAAQSRLTVIAGARDDFDPGLYRAPLAPDLFAYVEASPDTTAKMAAMAPLPQSDMLEHLLVTLERHRIGPVIVVPLMEEPVAVAKILVPGLENPPGRRRERFGARGMRALMAAA